MLSSTSRCPWLRWSALAALPLLAIAVHGRGSEPLPVVQHDIALTLTPDRHQIAVEDQVMLPADWRAGPDGKLHFLLHQGMQPTVRTKGVALEQVAGSPTAAHFNAPAGALELEPGAPAEHFALSLPAGVRTFTLRYGGTIDHPVDQKGEDYARSFGETPGLVAKEGVYLAGASYWLPWLGQTLITFKLDAVAPRGWTVVSQGAPQPTVARSREPHSKWVETQPQDEVFVVAAPFRVYRRQSGAVEVQVYLRDGEDPGKSASEEDTLAQKYLDVGGQYLDMYSKLLGDYPYAKFAVVENFWQTGYGMPSFTLLGSEVIRFPFILHSSYPHEILHNWWGNSVYVDYQSGNWCEGLTTYLADHLIAEQRGQGAEYRRDTLQKYADYVAKEKDMPLRDFRARYSSASQAIGYGKSMLLFHMLRRELGDDAFGRALRTLYTEHKFKRASFDDLRRVFEQVAGKSFEVQFKQWLDRPGAPELRIANARVQQKGNRWVLAARIEQVQPGAAYLLQLPIAVLLEGDPKPMRQQIAMDKQVVDFQLVFERRPLRLDVDPDFDLFRRLDASETPPALSALFGADRLIYVLPAKAPAEVRDAYRALVTSWNKDPAIQAELVDDSALEKLPTDRAIWLLGWDNRFRPAVETALKPVGARVDARSARFEGSELQRGQHSVIAVVRGSAGRQQTIGWLATDNVKALPGLGRKLPHYGKYGFLAFEGDEPANIAKGAWPVIGGPLTRSLIDKPGSTAVAAVAADKRQPLAELPPSFSRERLLDAVKQLASAKYQGRGFGTAESDAAAQWIADQLKAAGLQPAGDEPGSYFQSFDAAAGQPAKRARLKNVVAVIRGSNDKHAGQSVVVGAHYDHLGLGWPDVHQGDAGKLHPGADDNASGVAVALELARVLAASKPERSIVFAFFAGEEAGRLGSRHYVKAMQVFPAKRALAMINLDTVGRLGAGKLTVLGTGTAREWVHVFMGASYVTGVATQPVPSDVGGSDQQSFVEAGVPAVQLFSGPNGDYHRPSDNSDKIDADGLVKVSAIANEAIGYLAGRAEPLASTLSGASQPAVAGPPTGGERKVSLGTVPDMAYPGPGVKVSGVTPGSPAEKAGIKADDVVIRVGEFEIKDLRGLSQALKQLKPDQKVKVVFKRGDRQQQVELTVVAR